MPEGKLRVSASPSVETRVCPPEIQPLMQLLLAMLADIDFEHERELEKLRNSAMDARLIATMVGRLEQRHEERRDPYLRDLLNLQNRLRTVVGGGR
jgi:hypothetical protein